MGIVINGITLITQEPWSPEQTDAVQRACREVLQALRPEQPPSEEEVASYWKNALEKPKSAVVYGYRCPYSAYWQFYDDDREYPLLYELLEKYCRPLGMTVTSHACY